MMDHDEECPVCKEYIEKCKDYVYGREDLRSMWQDHQRRLQAEQEHDQ